MDSTDVVILDRVALKVECRGFDRQVLRPILGLLEADQAVAAAEVVLSRVPGSALPPLPVDAQPLFFHGRTAVRRRADGGLIVHDGDVHLVVKDERITGQLTERAFSPDAIFLRTTFVIALTLLMRRFDRYYLHAAAVQGPVGCVVLPAAGGVGKSTTCASLVVGGWNYLADDTVFVQDSPSGVRLGALPKPFHLSPRTLEAFPTLRTEAVGPYRDGSPKFEVKVEAAYPGRYVSEAFPSFLLFPILAPGALSVSRLSKLTAADALGRLIEASALVTVDGLPGSGPHLHLLERLAGSRPCFGLHLGSDVLEDPKGFGDRLVDALA